MATYKKRGGKERKPKVNDFDDAQDINFDGESTTKEVFDALDQSASKSEEWLEKNQKPVFIFLAAILAAVLLFVVYNKAVKGPKEVTAADELSYSKIAFDKAELAQDNIDSLYTIALNGVDGKYGLLDIAKKYANTDAGNMANYMAGMSFLKLYKYKEAISHLGKFTSEDQALAPLAKGNIGDAYADIDQLDVALDYYKQAANLNDNKFFTPMYLFKAGNTALDLGKYDEALKLFEQIKNKYPEAEDAKKIDVYIYRAKYASKK